uniref:Uncharacterized protein n=1 Tax=Oreochromis niloticus TaxID=8128 RepID=A0A669EUF8_ORENI
PVYVGRGEEEEEEEDGGVVLSKWSHKKIKDEEKEKEKKDKPEKANCFWESVTMTMRQISPAKKLEKIEGWEPPHLENFESSSSSLTAVTWTARAKVKLAGISRMSRGIVSESASVWEGFK